MWSKATGRQEHDLTQVFTRSLRVYVRNRLGDRGKKQGEQSKQEMTRGG